MSEAGTSGAFPMRGAGTSLIAAVGAVALGFACGHFESLPSLPVRPALDFISDALSTVWQACGMAFVGLVPLAAWLSWLIFKYLVLKRQASFAIQLDLAFISRNGPLFGLLGTVIALASAGATLAVEVESGGASAVLGVIPLVGQALFSTIVGILLAVGADVTLHVLERNDLQSSGACGE